MSARKKKDKVRSCGELSELYSDFVDGELDEASRRAVEHHLNLCAVCRADVTLMRAIVTNLAKVPEEEVPAGFAATVARQAAGHGKAPEPSWFERLLEIVTLPRVTVFAGAMAVVALLVLLPQGPLGQDPTVPGPVALRTEGILLEVASGRVTVDGQARSGALPLDVGRVVDVGTPADASLLFPGRTRVLIDEGTRLACVDRGIRLEAGSVRVDVPLKAKGPTPSFQVTTPNARVSVWGTRFAVQYRDGQTDVSVTEGVVAFAPLGGGQEQRIAAGSGAKVAADASVSVYALAAQPVTGPAAGAVTSEDTSGLQPGDGN